MKAKRLKKNPELADYVVEVTSPKAHPAFYYFVTRKDARSHMKASLARGASRVRVFHIKYTLASDNKAK